ncbi:Acetyltransferase (GNAT) domain-containing protein [Saccharopolyspora kobensis]|uniref:Acetyltransferase (GNAT) domain-containing protein n=2 Tax=Saccharopolyspora kobensis TaxID=146035 RepID=A0A1H5ZSZ0_9PSEU|nr:GNAT family N-acetyltransferase [Saccharopolyspora kobensis]SEG39270.1 Acetyltransferase (GNAT) domain-containing protein [Saccharopolyspora kobensis]SFE13369.1 Acetyltransferase (GNAT) family protein [Saccharopolyspora kobensis]
MPAWRVRDFHDDDLDQAIRIWDQSRETGEPVFSAAEVVSIARAGHPALVAVVEREVVGMAAAKVEGERAWLALFALDARWRNRGIGSALLAELEKKLRGLGVHRITSLVPEGAAGFRAMVNSGYRPRTDLTYFEKVEELDPADFDVLEHLGGMLLPPGRWAALAGMRREKDVIERRVVLPISHPDRAERHGVLPPKAIVLFGPPGTGKTSFAKAIASRLNWPFVELFPSRLAAASPEGLATSLREVFTELEELDDLVLFIDEVEEIAGTRTTPAAGPAHGVTNELLKLIPGFREHDHRLLVCATNSVSSLDPAFLRPGRFDYIIPVGPPDPPARRAIWSRYLGPARDNVDLDLLVERTELFTPADIEFAARQGAQAAFERDVLREDRDLATTAEYLKAIDDTRPTLTAEAIADFEQDIETCTRL